MVKQDHIFSIIELDEVSSAILNALRSQVAILNFEGKVVAFNKQWKEAGQEQEKDNNWSHPQLEESILKSLQNPLAEGNDFALRLLLGIKEVLSQEVGTFETKIAKTVGNQKKWFRVTVSSLGYEQGVVLIYDNVSDQTQVKNYLREARQLFETHFNNSLYGILIADDRNVVIDANNVACNILETTPQAITYSELSKYLEPKLNLDSADLQKRINREGNNFGEYELNTANGNTVPVELSVTMFRNSDGSTTTSWAFSDISAKKEAEKARDHSEHQYKLQFNNTMMGTLIGRPNGSILAANPAACTMMGYPEEELIKGGRTLVFDVSLPGNAQALKERREDGSFSGELQFTHKDGHKIPVEVNSVIFDAEDGTEKTIISMNDVSSRKNIQQQLLQEKDFTELAISALPTAFFVFSVEGEMVRWNSILEQDLGYTAEEISGMNVMEFVHPEDRHLLQNILKDELKGNKLSIEARCISQEGEAVHYLIRGTSFEQNGKKFIVGGGINRSDFKEAELERRRNSELLNQLFYNSPVGIVLINSDGNIQSANNSFEHIFGFESDEINGKNLDDLIVPKAMNAQGHTFSQKSFTGDSFQTEAVRLHKNGTEIPVLVGGVPVELEGEVIAIYGMYVDITERKHLENQIIGLLETEKTARLHLQEMFDEAPSAIAMLEGPKHVYTYANEKFKELIDQESLEGKMFDRVLPELSEQGFSEVLETCYSSGESYHFNERKVYFKNGEDGRKITHYLNFVFKPLQGDGDDIYGILIEAIDVTEQVMARNIIEKSLAEKNTLLGEVHHRVKNNLAIISGLLELELMDNDSDQVNKLLSSTQSRITSIAKIHELLYQNESLSHVNFKDYITKVLNSDGKLMEDLIDTLSLNDVIMNVNQAIPAGILLNELMSFMRDIHTTHYENKKGDLELILSSEGGSVSISFQEHSKNYIEYYETHDDSFSTLREELISVLLLQLEGELKIDEDQGVLTVSFTKREIKGPHNTLNN